MRARLVAATALSLLVLAAAVPAEEPPRVVIFGNGRVLPVKSLSEEGGQLRLESLRGEAFLVERSLLRTDEMAEVNAALAALARSCGDGPPQVAPLSPGAASVLARVGPDLLGTCWPEGFTPRLATPTPAPSPTPVPTRDAAAPPPTAGAPTPTPRPTVLLTASDGDEVVLSDAADQWGRDHVVARVPAGTGAVVLEEEDLPVDEWSLVRLRVRVLDGPAAGVEGWVFYQNVESPP